MSDAPGEPSHAADLALARACASGEPAAVAEVERRLRGELAGALSRVGLTRAEIDEVGQIVRERLLVARPGATPKIGDYSGRGAFLGWLRAVIVRAGIDHRRSRARAPDAPGSGEREGDDEPLLRIGDASDDPEIETLRARYAAPFRAALADAIAALPPDERNALRLSVAEGLSVDAIGGLYGVHRATAARWIARARETIAEETRRLLLERLGLQPSEVDSLVRLCRSRVDIGISVLGTE